MTLDLRQAADEIQQAVTSHRSGKAYVQARNALARAAALNEAADHLENAQWTFDPRQAAAGLDVAEKQRQLAESAIDYARRIIDRPESRPEAKQRNPR